MKEKIGKLLEFLERGEGAGRLLLQNIKLEGEKQKNS